MQIPYTVLLSFASAVVLEHYGKQGVLMMMGITGRIVPAVFFTTGIPDLAAGGLFIRINS